MQSAGGGINPGGVPLALQSPPVDGYTHTIFVGIGGPGGVAVDVIVPFVVHLQLPLPIKVQL